MRECFQEGLQDDFRVYVGDCLLKAKTFGEFLKQPVGDGENPVGGHPVEVMRMDGFQIMESGEDDLEQVLTDTGQSPFGGQVGFIQIVEAAGGSVGIENGPGYFAQIEVHCVARVLFSEACINR